MYDLIVGNIKGRQEISLIFISFRAKCYLKRINMLKVASTLSECVSKPTDLTLSCTGINLRENVSTVLVKTNLSSVNIDLF